MQYKFTLSKAVGKLMLKTGYKYSTMELSIILGLHEHTIRAWQSASGPASAKIETINKIISAFADEGISITVADLVSPIDKLTNT